MDFSDGYFVEDPWRWTVDQVVTALCDPNANYRAGRNPAALPNATWLEQTLRENVIEGDSLLIAINFTTLKEEFGIRPLGHRQIIVREIQRLRRGSRQYAQYAQEELPDALLGQGPYDRSTRRAESFLQNPTPAVTPKLPPTFVIPNQAPPDPGVTDQAISPTSNGHRPPPCLQSSIQNSQQWLDALPDGQETPIVDGSVTADDDRLDRRNEKYVVDGSGRKRRKLFLTAEASHHVEELQPTAEVDAKVCQEEKCAAGRVNAPIGPLDGPRSPSSSLKVADANGRKRIAPTLVSKPQDPQDVSNPSAVDSKPVIRKDQSEVLSRLPAEGYLGIQSFPVDTLFYDSTRPTQSHALLTPAVSDDECPGNVAFMGTSASNGQRLYVAARVKYFLQQRLALFRRGKKCSYGICPYPRYFGRVHDKASVTIFDSATDGGEIVTTRKNQNEWLPVSTSGTLTDVARLEHSDQDALDVPVSLTQADDQDWDYLEKWRHAPDDHVLPVYGDSGSEGEYDLDTWRDMEKESGSKLLRPLGRSRGTRILSAEEVLHAIEGATQGMTQDWKDKQLPKLQRTAWLLWGKSRRNGTKRTRIASLEFDIQHLTSRLGRLRAEIEKEQWSSAVKIARQCESMRRTLYDLETSRWRAEVLQLKIRPDKVGRVNKPASDKPCSKSMGADSGSEGSSTVETSAGEELEDFIVDDDDSEPDETMVDEVDEFDEDSSADDGTPAHGERPILSQRPKSEPVPPPMSPSHNIIDLTTLESGESETEAVPGSTAFASIDITSSPIREGFEDHSQRIKRKIAQYKSPQGLGKYKDAISKPLPKLFETEAISRMEPAYLMERADRKRLLTYVLAHTSSEWRKRANDWLVLWDVEQAQIAVWQTLASLRESANKVTGAQNRQSEILKKITAWFVQWTNVTIIAKGKGAKREQMDVAAADEEGFEHFFNFLKDRQCLVDYQKTHRSTPTEGSIEQYSQPTPSKHKRIRVENVSGDEANKNRTYVVQESQQAAEVRKKAHQRVEEREARQAKLKKTLKKMGQTEEDARQVVVNLGKHEDQDLIYLLPTIGGRIQPHQKDGLRFLWREIIEDHASNQGALLAQTMGLGKTMQVISFLLTVADAAKSTNANIRNQIPDRLRESKTLVLCPPSLVENWYDEFLLWAPNDMATNIGEVRTVLSGMLLEERLQTIRDWGDDGGVLVLGSSLLRELITNPTRKGQDKHMLDEDVHAEIKDVLLNGPNIVVCDEAHAAKSQSSQLNKILAQFKSTSRIALTGSPLCNNLSEYYALIQWIAPGYLGEHPEFVYKYKEPIEQGLYQDSNASEWRKGLKKLELFKREVQPKVHRADNSVLASRLQGKSEFVVKVALTELQQKLYRTFVDSMKEQLEHDEGVAKQARLWAWVSKLRLVCNHPCCFHDYLSGRNAPKPRAKRRKPVQVSVLDDVKSDDEDGADGSPTELGMPDHVVRKLLGVFNGLPIPLESVHLAYKMTVLLKIIELCHVAKDKILVFSHSLRTLDYVERVLRKHEKQYRRMDGKVPTQRRQAMTKEFNRGTSQDVFLISTRAGGTGLNLFGASRVIILDDHFNPTWEEQAIGRAYRIGQSKHVYVYRLTAGGTFEEALHNQTLFKQQLATRAVDQRNIARLATRGMQDYFKHCQTVEQMDLDPFKGKDPDVLDHILASQSRYLLRPCPSIYKSWLANII